MRRLTPVKADPSERPTAATGRRPAPEKDPAKFETSRLSAGPTTRPGLTTSSPPSHPSSSSRPAGREAERRQVTIFYCNHNLGETVELFEVLEPGDRDLLLGRWAKLCEEEVDRYQGTMLSSSGPGLMVCFGYPLAFEDAAHRAVQAGLRILKGSARLSAEFPRLKGVDLATWVTVHTGAAVVGDAARRGGEAVSILGEARSVAARLEPMAEPGTLIISETVHHLVQGYFVCESLGCHTIKGLARPLEFFRVLRRGSARSRIDAAGTAGLTPLIGRDLEVGLLQDRWQQAGEGIGQTVLLVGEAGIGKSRLVHVMKERVGEHADASTPGVPPVVEWRCSPFYQNSGLYPAIEFFERFLALQPEDPPERHLETLVGHLRSLGMEDPEAVSLLAGMLSIPRDEARYPTPNVGPQRLKERTAETLIDWLRACAERQPLLFIVEDLHWVDASTLEVLGQLAEQAAADRLLSVMTTRPDFSPPWAGRMHLTQVTLNRLNRQQIAELIRRKSGIVVLPPSLVDQIVDRTDGVPLFVEEFTRMVLEAGILREREVEGELSMTSSSLIQAIPATLQDLLMARLDRMGSRREVVQLASVLGREFSLDLLRAVSPLEEGELQHELTKLVHAEILFPRGRTPHASYLFKHALIQEAAYQSLLKSRRQQFHRDIARVLEEQLPEKARREPELLAHHHTEAGQVGEALAYWEKAGRRAIEHSAHPEAIAHLTRGLSLLPSLEESPGRDLQEFHLQLLLGVAVMAVEGYAAPRLTSIHGRAHDLCIKLGANEPLFQVMWGIWAWSFIRDELEFGAGLAREIAALAATLGDPGYRMEAHFAVGCNAFYRGEFLTSRKECELGLTLYTPERGRFHCGYTGQDSGVTNQCYSACSLWYQGYPDQALRRVARAVALGRGARSPLQPRLRALSRRVPEAAVPPGAAGRGSRRDAPAPGRGAGLPVLGRPEPPDPRHRPPAPGRRRRGDRLPPGRPEGPAGHRAPGSSSPTSPSGWPRRMAGPGDSTRRSRPWTRPSPWPMPARSCSTRPSSTGSAASSSSPARGVTIRRPPPRPRPASTGPSRPPAASAPARSSCGPPPASPACSDGSPAPIRPARSSPPCTNGSPRGSRPATWPTPGPCSMDWPAMAGRPQFETVEMTAGWYDDGAIRDRFDEKPWFFRVRAHADHSNRSQAGPGRPAQGR